MKRIYAESYMDRTPRRRRQRRSKLGSFSVKNVKLWAVGLVLLLAFIFFISGLLTAADANIGPAVGESDRVSKAPPGTKPAAPGVWANAAVLTAAESGRVLYTKAALGVGEHGRVRPHSR